MGIQVVVIDFLGNDFNSDGKCRGIASDINGIDIKIIITWCIGIDFSGCDDCDLFSINIKIFFNIELITLNNGNAASGS